MKEEAGELLRIARLLTADDPVGFDIEGKTLVIKIVLARGPMGQEVDAFIKTLQKYTRMIEGVASEAFKMLRENGYKVQRRKPLIGTGKVVAITVLMTVDKPFTPEVEAELEKL